MRIDRVASAIGGSDLSDDSIDRPHTAAARRNPHDGQIGYRLDALARPDLGKVGAPVDPVDNQIMPVVELVGEAAHDHAPDDRCGAFGSEIEDDPIGGGALQLPRGQLALHGADDVAALADAAERVDKAVGETPARSA